MRYYMMLDTASGCPNISWKNIYPIPVEGKDNWKQKSQNEVSHFLQKLQWHHQSYPVFEKSASWYLFATAP